MLPLAKWIFDRIGNDKLKRKDLIRKLGFTNLNKGNIVLNDILLGNYSEKQIEDLKIALSDNDLEFEKVVKENELHLALIKGYRQIEKDKYEKSIFKPYIKLGTEKFSPGNFLSSVRLSLYVKIYLSRDIVNKPIGEQISIVKEKIIEKYSNYYSDEFLYPRLGRIVSIKYQYDFYCSVDIDFEDLIQEHSINSFCARTDSN